MGEQYSLKTGIFMWCTIIPCLYIILAMAYLGVTDIMVYQECESKCPAGEVAIPISYGCFCFTKVNDYWIFSNQTQREYYLTAVENETLVNNMMDDVFFRELKLSVVSIGVTPFRINPKCLEYMYYNNLNYSICYAEWGVEYVCCTSLRTPKLGGIIQDICEDYKTKEAAIQLNGVGDCWRVE